MQTQYNQLWDLDSIFPGGSESTELRSFIKETKEELVALEQSLQQLTELHKEKDKFVGIIESAQNVAAKVREVGAFIGCLTAQNAADKKAIQLSGTAKELSSLYQGVLTSIDEKIMQLDEAELQSLIDNHFKDVAFYLNERAQRASEKLSPAEEKLAQKLSTSGYHAWADMYNALVNSMKITFEENGKTEELSVGQAENKLANSDRQVRIDAFGKWEKTWTENEDLFATTINHLAGFRLGLYEKRGWTNVLKEPLEINRMSEATLNAMWDTITKNKTRFMPYLERKAKYLGLEKLAWYDVHAPIGSSSSSIPYEEAAETIIEQFGKFSPKMAEFTKMAFEKDWVEAENRPGKRPGAFCTTLPASGETRVFMTYSGSASNVSTLAHELGHAYHAYVMRDMPNFAQSYAMNVAETASTFAELIVSDAAVQQAESDEEKLVLIESKLGRAIAFFMNIHARFLFETRFYENRKEGLLSANDLNELMVEAQKEAYCDSLSEYHPHFWAAKQHFHITGVPFYNFPYTFGFLFSLGVYAHALEKGASFEDGYVELLRDTGSMNVEELAQKHLNVDLTQADFWQKAIDLVVKDVDQFLELTE
ncbi:M3 family oligoendopeptidase [Alkalihalobacterium elongatum]|uniref:M3 family oligoendopeptidase n=1 Tax=Alkalihalobacterium elongatum TaxID=2675466 RepID=UPI001C1F9600|nr:M3 family oligoendopeptidase [Alkalihalobacterium elongatum]